MVQKMYAALATSVLGPDLLGCFFFFSTFVAVGVNLESLF